MKKGLRSKWVKALRSGSYMQGIESLRRENGTFCCLGVLCDVVDPDGWRKPPAGLWTIHDLSNITGTDIRHSLPSLGLREDDHDNLIKMNDRGDSFLEIADWIEENIS